MDVVSTSNLVSLETEKTTAAWNFQTMAMNSFVMPRDLQRCKYDAIRSFMIAELWNSTLRNTYTRQYSKIKTGQQ